MRIALFTNTYLPHVGGVANSVTTLADGLRDRGHKVLITAPDFPDQPENEEDVVRISSIRNFNGTDFSFKLPSGTKIRDAIKSFQPDLIHAHHPFLLGDAAMRMAHEWHLPLVFTHHTKYEDYVHYIFDDSEWLERLAIEMATEYSNLSDTVIAPSGSIKKLIRERGVKVPISVIPTGIDYERFSNGDGKKLRQKLGISGSTFLLGHVGRIAEEKNLIFLIKSVVHYLKANDDSQFLLVGSGDSLEEIKEILEKKGLSERVHYMGILTKQDLVDAYHAMDCFIFSSKSETQGMVIAEAMAAGRPIVALDASGIRDILEDGNNGRMLPAGTSAKDFSRAIGEFREKMKDEGDEIYQNMKESAHNFSVKTCLDRVEDLYRELIQSDQVLSDRDGWQRFANRVEAEWDLAVGRARAVGAAFTKEAPE